jgi:anti-anti-sigma factor
MVDRPYAMAGWSSSKLMLEVEGTGPARTLHLAGELDILDAARLERLLQELMEKSEEVVLDMSRLTFIDSAGLNAVLRGCRQPNCKVRATDLQPQVARVVEVTGASSQPPFVEA